MSKSILFVTGTRADFGKLEPLAVAARDARFKVSFFVTGMHMMQRYRSEEQKSELQSHYSSSYAVLCLKKKKKYRKKAA